MNIKKPALGMKELIRRAACEQPYKQAEKYVSQHRSIQGLCSRD